VRMEIAHSAGTPLATGNRGNELRVTNSTVTAHVLGPGRRLTFGGVTAVAVERKNQPCGSCRLFPCRNFLESKLARGRIN